MDEKELRRILTLINQAYEEAGRSIETAVLLDGDDEAFLIDNRTDEEIN